MALPLATQGADWQPLFNGCDLEGWDAILIKHHQADDSAENYFKVENGAIHVYAGKENGSAQPFAALVSKQSFSHYHLSLEYRWGVAKFQPRVELLRDAGLLYHVHGQGRPAWPLSVESQIQEGETGDTYTIGTQVSAWLDPGSHTPAANGQVAHYSYLPHAVEQRWIATGVAGKILRIRHNQPSEVSGWNRLEIIVEGDRAIHRVNGITVMQIADFRRWDDSTQQWAPLTSGKLLLQAEGAEVFYRNIRIRSLPTSGQ
ncbi:3-keto-disaccharide hydrolase [Alteromonas aestuariivivens]|uniref:3-keto-disaccharide hydrolase n=1 Tax=Alteromonas aestuariivivens TaxID=1938339 RepID=UPI0015F24F1F|nr:DUF1080 domain-containing protein [Alteromonas aestuariivivens]